MSAAAKELPSPRYGSAAQVASYAGLSTKSVRRLVDSGAIRGLKVGRRLLIPFEDVDRHILKTEREPVMATIHRIEPAEARPPLPPVDPAEVRRRNRAAAALVRKWMAEGDEDEQTASLEVLKEALGPNRVMSSRPAL